jgi:hypothetical protein
MMRVFARLSLEALGEQLKTALNSPSPWERHRKEIIRCSRVEFDAARVRQALYACFSKCADHLRRKSKGVGCGTGRGVRAALDMGYNGSAKRESPTNPEKT